LVRTAVAVVLAVAVLPSPVGAAKEPDGREDRPYIVTLDVVDAGRALDPTVRTGRERVRLRARRTRDATARLERSYDFRSTHRFSYAVSGFAARLTPRQAAELGRDRAVASVRPARRFTIASQTVPVGVRRVRAVPAGAPAVDADIAVLDTGIGPVGGDELNLKGGVNCSGDGLGAGEFSDLYRSRHGTHVAGTAAARDNGIGTVGVAPGARLWSVRVFRANGYGDETTIICGLDWVLATLGPTPPAGSQPIEVVNMSLEGPRPDDDPEGCTGRPTPDPDPMHLAVCAVHAAGVTMVSAAGNDAIDTRFVSPAGYDQVITVAAISDYDGQAGGKADPICGGVSFGSDGDDRFARYSNRGGDVDLVAPGTCVISTFPTGSGDATQRLTGTSMATPHVAGAVARYLADHPGTDPERMRRVVRAAGRLDWEIGSDPGWDGPNDDRAPKRLLDVAALVGSPDLRVWLVPRNLVASDGTKKRRVRVDVQRLGGYDGDVSLGIDDLPGGVAATTFAPATLALDGLGGHLALSFGPDAREGRYKPQVSASGGPHTGGRTFTLRVDRTGPVIGGIRLAIAGTRASGGRKARLRVAWTVDDALGKVGRTALQRRVGDGPWREVAAGRGLTKATTSVRAGTRTSLRVVSRDDLGNVSRSRIRTVHLSVRDSASSTWASGWQTTSSDGAIGGSLLTTSAASSSLTTRIDGLGFAVVAPVGPGRGTLRLRLDGGSWRTVDLRAKASRARRIVHRAQLAPGAHTLEVRADSGKPAVDALLLIR
jgi:subtilisin family serine protease